MVTAVVVIFLAFWGVAGLISLTKQYDDAAAFNNAVDNMSKTRK